MHAVGPYTGLEGPRLADWLYSHTFAGADHTREFRQACLHSTPLALSVIEVVVSYLPARFTVRPTKRGFIWITLEDIVEKLRLSQDTDISFLNNRCKLSSERRDLVYSLWIDSSPSHYWELHESLLLHVLFRNKPFLGEWFPANSPRRIVPRETTCSPWMSEALMQALFNEEELVKPQYQTACFQDPWLEPNNKTLFAGALREYHTTAWV